MLFNEKNGLLNKVLEVNARRRLDWLANRLWHTDASFVDPPGRYSMLSARVLPPVRADTEFADMRAAYDALDAATRAGEHDATAGGDLDDASGEHRRRLGDRVDVEVREVALVGVDHLGVGPRLGSNPFEKIDYQRVYGIRHVHLHNGNNPTLRPVCKVGNCAARSAALRPS